MCSMSPPYDRSVMTFGILFFSYSPSLNSVRFWVKSSSSCSVRLKVSQCFEKNKVRARCIFPPHLFPFVGSTEPLPSSLVKILNYLLAANGKELAGHFHEIFIDIPPDPQLKEIKLQAYTASKVSFVYLFELVMCVLYQPTSFPGILMLSSIIRHCMTRFVSFSSKAFATKTP